MALRMKVQTTRSLLFLGVFLGVAAILFLVSRLFIDLKKKTLFPQIPPDKISEAANKASPSKGVEASGSGEGARDYKAARVIWELNITGKEPEKPADVAGSQPTAQTEKKLEDVINVMLLFWAPEPEKRCAKIAYDEDLNATPVPANAVVAPGTNRGRQKPETLPTYKRIGDKLRAPYDGPQYNGKIVDITKEAVICEWYGKQVEVKPSRIDTSGVDKKPVQKLPGLDPNDPDASQPAEMIELKNDSPMGANGWFIGTDTRDLVERDYEKLLDTIELAPDFDPRVRGRIRLKISKLPDDHLAAKRGFEVGDVIKKVNGVDISSKASLANYIKENKSLSNYSIEIERRGSTITKEFRIAR